MTQKFCLNGWKNIFLHISSQQCTGVVLTSVNFIMSDDSVTSVKQCVNSPDFTHDLARAPKAVNLQTLFSAAGLRTVRILSVSPETVLEKIH